MEKENHSEKQPEVKPEAPQTQIEELTELLKRNQANFENYRKQNEKRMEEFQQFANKNMLLKILPLVDNFELALKTNCTTLDDLRKGIEMIYSQFYNFLEEQEVKSFGQEGEMFNPNLHEALMKVDSDKPENTVIEVLQKGFMLNERVIRHAKVKVSNGKRPKHQECNIK
jgi:molecular chaperone GrpE